MWLSTALLTIARCSGINPYTEYHKLGVMFTEPDRIVKLLEDEYNPLIVQQRQEFMLLELPPPPSADDISRGLESTRYKTGRTKITKLQLTFDLDDADSVLSTDQSHSAATSSRRSRNSRSQRSTTQSEPRNNAVKAPSTPTASNSSMARDSQRQHFSHDPTSAIYASWADAASVDSSSADRQSGHRAVDLSNTTTTTRSDVPTSSSRSWTEVVTNRTNILGRRRSGNLLGGVLNRGLGTPGATQSVLSANSVNSEVSTATAATVLQLQTQIRDLQKSQEEKLQDLQVKHDSELNDIKAGHMSEIEKLHEAIDTIKLQIHDLVLASSERARLASLQLTRESPAATVPSINELVDLSTVSGATVHGSAQPTLPGSPSQQSSRRTLNGPKRARVSSSPQTNRFEILSPSSMDEDDEFEELLEDQQEMSHDEIQMDQDVEVEQTVQQVQLLQIQQQHDPDFGSNGAGTEPC